MEEPLNLKKFIWTREDKYYAILAITDFQEYNVVVYREVVNGKGGLVGVATVSDFCDDFTATYQLSP